jgi:hypothetical protein
MPIFRKKISHKDANFMMFTMFEEQCSSFLNRTKVNILRISPRADILFLDDQARVEKMGDLWAVSAAFLSQIRHRPEASLMTAGILAVYDSAENRHDQITFELAASIVGSKPDDSNLFHRTSYDIILKSFPEISDFICCHPDQVQYKHAISGIELAACLRAVDFILKDFKVA